jgi:hypothetical protein
MFRPFYKAVIRHRHKNLRIKQVFWKNSNMPVSDDGFIKGPALLDNKNIVRK